MPHRPPYNQAGRLASTSAGTQYTYDAFGHRLVKVGSATAMSLFQYDRFGHLLEETDNQGNVRADYIYLDGRPIAEYSVGKLYFLHDDRLGTPQVATDTTQAPTWVGNYQPFGALTASSQTALLGQDLRLPGQENDLETGLYHNGFRDYAPGWGRYVQSDPIGLGGGINTYLYTEGNPLRYIDLLGTQEAYPFQNYLGNPTASDAQGLALQQQLEEISISATLCPLQLQGLAELTGYLGATQDLAQILGLLEADIPGLGIADVSLNATLFIQNPTFANYLSFANSVATFLYRPLSWTETILTTAGNALLPKPAW